MLQGTIKRGLALSSTQLRLRMTNLTCPTRYLKMLRSRTSMVNMISRLTHPLAQAQLLIVIMQTTSRKPTSPMGFGTLEVTQSKQKIGRRLSQGQVSNRASLVQQRES